MTAKQVMKIILIQKKLQARTIEENTIIIFPDNETNRQRYGQYEIWPSKSDAKQAIKIVLVAKRLQARIIEEKKIIVFPDHEANRQKYGQYELWPAKSDANK